MTDSFYRAFEDKYRGSHDLIKSRLQVYLPFIKPLLDKKQTTTPKALDLGCGRGEWLELLTEQGFIAQGVDLDEGMLEACWELGLKAEKTDALDYLKALKANSIAIISGFHIAEHIAFEKLEELVEQALRVLKPGGLLILETPNPENIVVGTANFYLDPTHQRPLPPLLLSFIAEHAGYARVKTLRLQEPEGIQESPNLALIDVLSGVSPDYSIVAQKTAAKSALKKFDAAFSKEYGVTLNEIANLYEGQLKNKTDNLKTEWDGEHQRAELLTTELGVTREQKAAAEAVKELLTAELEATREQKAAAEAVKEQLTAELVTTHEQKAAAEAVKERLVQDIQLMEQRIEAANREIAELKTEHSTELDRECQRAEQLNTELNTIKEQYEHLNLSAQSIQNEKNAAMDKIYELECKSHHWWLEANRLTNSRSWRITRPLRLIGRMLRWCLFLPGRFARMVKRQVKKILRPILLMAMRLIQRRPGLKRVSSALLRHFPSLHNRLQIVAANARSRSQNTNPNRFLNQSSVPSDSASEHHIIKESEELKSENNIELFISRIYSEIEMRDNKEESLSQRSEK